MLESQIPPKNDFLEKLEAYFLPNVPHSSALGMEIEQLSAGCVQMRLPYQPHFRASIHAEHWHGGVITSLIDTACGLAAFSLFDKPRTLATLDLRLDYVRPVLIGQDVRVWASCERQGAQTAFVHAIAFQAERHVPLVQARSVFRYPKG